MMYAGRGVFVSSFK